MSIVKAFALKKGKVLAVFNEDNLYQIIKAIEKMEQNDEDIWVPISILEYMYEDDIGVLDYYFQSKPEDRNMKWLFSKINFDK